VASKTTHYSVSKTTADFKKTRASMAVNEFNLTGSAKGGWRGNESGRLQKAA
jgi:hypothetical protein